MRKKIAMIDLRTGEMLDGTLVWVGVKKNPYAGGWIMTNQEALLALATDREISGETYRVLMFLLYKLDFENFIQVSQVEIAQALGMRKSNVSRAVRVLCDKGILLRGPKVGRSYCFRLNPHYGWKGRVKNLSEERQRRRRQ